MCEGSVLMPIMVFGGMAAIVMLPGLICMYITYKENKEQDTKNKWYLQERIMLEKHKELHMELNNDLFKRLVKEFKPNKPKTHLTKDKND